MIEGIILLPRSFEMYKVSQESMRDGGIKYHTLPMIFEFLYHARSAIIMAFQMIEKPSQRYKNDAICFTKIF